MSEKRFAIKPQDDYWAVIDNHNDDKVCIINGIHTEIEAIWLCDFMNEQQATINELKEENKKLIEEWEFSFRTEMAHHRFAEKELQEKIREKQATIKSKDKQLERLYNYFQDYLKDEMGGNAFSEMWDFVKEDESWEDE